MTFRLPSGGEHTSIVGRTGTGKTQAGAWLLSKQDLMAKPWIIVDYKGEELFSSLKRAREIGFEVPRQGGLFVLHSGPDLVDETESWLFDVWRAENIGLLIDEAYMLPQLKAYRSLLTQGRSKHIPIITLSQRPVEIDRFAFSEASHVVVFHLNDVRDRKTVSMFTPPGFVDWVPDEFAPGAKSVERLPDFHSRWYSVKTDSRYVMRPVPNAEKIIEAIDDQLPPKLRWI